VQGSHTRAEQSKAEQARLESMERAQREKERRISELQNDLNDKDISLDKVKSELYSTKEKLELVKLENAKLKDSLNETSNELLIVTNKQKVQSFSSTIDNNATLNLNAYDTQEITQLRNEVSFLKDKVNQMEKLNRSTDDIENVNKDLLTVREYKHNLEQEKAKTNKIYKILLSDRDNFKSDYEQLKNMSKDAPDYEHRRSSLKKIKAVLDGKIANINHVISTINKVEGFLNEYEGELVKK